MEEESTASWYHLPFYRALTEPILVLGAPRTVLIVNGAVSFMFVMYFHFVYILALSVVLHLLCVHITRGDAQFFDCFWKYLSRKNYYST